MTTEVIRFDPAIVTAHPGHFVIAQIWPEGRLGWALMYVRNDHGLTVQCATWFEDETDLRLRRA